MKNLLDWNSIRLFLEVARCGGLTQASKNTKLSPATLGRHMTEFEKEMSVQLFIRKQTGYQLTRDGLELLNYAEEIERSAKSIEQWRDQQAQTRCVRITAGDWMSHFLTSQIKLLRQPDELFNIEFMNAHHKLDIGRRQADIGIRNHCPEERWLARQRIGKVAFAVYEAKESAFNEETNTPWIGYSHDKLALPSAQWLNNHHQDNIIIRINSPYSLLNLVCDGVGRSVLPCFIGDNDNRLQRVGTIIDELTHEQWLVSHHEDRHDENIRIVLDRLIELISDSQSLFGGVLG